MRANPLRQIQGMGQVRIDRTIAPQVPGSAPIQNALATVCRRS